MEAMVSLAAGDGLIAATCDALGVARTTLSLTRSAAGTPKGLISYRIPVFRQDPHETQRCTRGDRDYRVPARPVTGLWQTGGCQI
jgi:hypothetical protein